MDGIFGIYDDHAVHEIENFSIQDEAAPPTGKPAVFLGEHSAAHVVSHTRFPVVVERVGQQGILFVDHFHIVPDPGQSPDPIIMGQVAGEGEGISLHHPHVAEGIHR